MSAASEDVGGAAEPVVTEEKVAETPTTTGPGTEAEKSTGPKEDVQDDDDDDDDDEEETGMKSAYSVSDLLCELDDDTFEDALDEEQTTADTAAEDPAENPDVVDGDVKGSTPSGVEGETAAEGGSVAEGTAEGGSENEQPPVEAESKEQPDASATDNRSPEGASDAADDEPPAIPERTGIAKVTTSEVPTLATVEVSDVAPESQEPAEEQAVDCIDDIYVNADNILRRKHALKLTPEEENVGYGSTVHSDISGRFPVDGSLDNGQVAPQSDEQYAEPACDAEEQINWSATYEEIPARGGDDAIYENVNFATATLDSMERDDGWSSSEFESCDEAEKDAVSTSSQPARPVDNQTVMAVFDRLAAKLGPRSRKDEPDEDDAALLESVLEMAKHPRAQLPPEPDDLTELQKKRRHIVASIVESENSFVNSLQRIVQDYEQPLLQLKPLLLSRSAIKVIFYKVKEILHCHSLFNIELAEHVRAWDEEEKLGTVFTASFSKLMVFDAYSAFVNNFSLAMETAKKNARSKHAFAEFLKQRLESCSDRLSLFGLMVKPVQRFPQFIMLIQDLLKHTPAVHHDRLLLQMALTELESLTHKLNETKRESESRHDVKRVMASLTGRNAIKASASRYLVRQDDMLQTVETNGETKTKQRRIFLMNDRLVCTTAMIKETDIGPVEKYRYKWSCLVRDVDVVEAPVTVKKSGVLPTKAGNWTAMPNGNQSNPWKKDIEDILHDLPILEKIRTTITDLRLNYKYLNEDSMKHLLQLLQTSMRQKSDVEKCVIQLSTPMRNGSRVIHTLQAGSLTIRHDWLLELQNTKLALDPRNNPGWSVPENETHLISNLPLFIKPLLIDIIKQESKKLLKKKYKPVVQCAVAVQVPCADTPGTSVEHLWVCSGDRGRSQVALVALHTQHPHMVESFVACDAVILCVEAVAGFSGGSENSVWMGTDDKEIVVHTVVSEMRDKPLMTISVEAKVMSLKYLEGRVYAALKNGHILVYSMLPDGTWQTKKKETLKIGKEPISCILPVGHDLWAAHMFDIHIIGVSESTGLTAVKSSHQVASDDDGCIDCMVKAGVGLLVSFQKQSLVRVYHLETLQHLQDVNIASAVSRLMEGNTVGDISKGVKVTYLLACRGCLWVGTSAGCVLKLPLPRLEGVPQTKGRPIISYHAHSGPIKFLSSIQCGLTHIPQKEEEVEEEEVTDANAAEVASIGDEHGFTQSDSHFSGGGGGQALMNGDALIGTRCLSTPDLYGVASRSTSDTDITDLYGSLMTGLDDDLEVPELTGATPLSPPPPPPSGVSAPLTMPAAVSIAASRVKRRARLNFNSMSTAFNARLSQLSQLVPSSPRAKGADTPPPPLTPRSTAAPVDELVSSGEGEVVGGRVSARPAVTMTTTTRLAHAAKSLIVVSGGEGHVNWSDPQANELKYEDICLLLWKCRT